MEQNSMVLREILHNGEQQLRKQKEEEQITEDILEYLEMLNNILASRLSADHL